MKASELIEAFKKIIAKEGDVDVYIEILGYNEWETCGSFTTYFVNDFHDGESSEEKRVILLTNSDD